MYFIDVKSCRHPQLRKLKNQNLEAAICISITSILRIPTLVFREIFNTEIGTQSVIWNSCY
jgi:hypothetical protein